MRDALRIFKRDLKRLAKAPAAWIVAIALIVLPSLYAWINVYGFWNPYDNTAELRVCLVNEDEGVNDKTLGKLDLGAEIVKDLQNNDQLDWAFVDRDEAMEQIAAGKAYAAFVIPPAFSANVASLTTGKIEKAQIEYYVNEKIGPVAPKFMDKGANTLDESINSAFISQVSSTIASKIDDEAAEVKQDIEKTTAASFKRVDKAINAIGDIRKSLQGLSDDATAAQEKSANARASLEAEKDTLASLVNDLKQTAELVGSANESSARLSQELGDALDNGGSALSLAASQTNLAIANTASKITTAKGDVDGAIAQMNAIVQQQAQMIATLREIESALPEGDARQAVSDQIQSLENANNEAMSIAEGLATLSGDIGATATNVAAASDAVNTATQQAVSIGSDYRSTVNNETLPAVSTGISTLASASTQLAATVASLTSLVDQANGTLKQLETALAQSAKAFGQTDSLLSDAQSDLQSIKADLSALGASDALHELFGAELDSNKIAEFMLSPTTVKTEELYPLDAYGSAMAPLFMNLTLWIGVFMLMVIMRIEVDEEEVARASAPQRFLGRQMLLAGLAALQAVVCCAGCIALGVQVANVPLLFLTAITASLAYLAIQYSLSATFQHLGKAMCLLLVFVQIPGATGLYPIEMTTDFFRTLYPIFPFTYGINAIRETVFGLYGNLWIGYIGILVAFMAAFTLFGAVARPFTANLNRLFERQIEETDLINIEPVQLPERRYQVSQLIDVIASRDEYRRRMEMRTAQFMHNYPRFKGVAAALGIIVPIVVTPILALTSVDRVVILTAWLLWLVAIAIALVVIEYIRDSMEHQLSLSELSGKEIRSLYFNGSGKGRKQRIADMKSNILGKHGKGGDA